jgi:hypothetical protein
MSFDGGRGLAVNLACLDGDWTAVAIPQDRGPTVTACL